MAETQQELIESGMRRPAIGLCQQVRTTVLVAKKDGDALLKLLPTTDTLEKATQLVGDVESAMKDRDIAEADAKGATRSQDQYMAKGKVWLRRTSARSKRALRLGGVVPKELLVPGRVRAIPKMITVVKKTTNLLEKHEADLAKAGGNLNELIDEGKEIHEKLTNYDAVQEAAWISSVPQAVRDFWEAKGLLYQQLKVINDAGKELYADDLQQAAKYNMEILYRKGE